MTTGSVQNLISVAVEITEQDVIDFRHYHLRHSRVVRRQMVIAVLVILVPWCAVLALMVFTSDKPLQAAKDLWPLLCGPVLFPVIFVSLQRWRIKRLSRRFLQEGRNRAMLGRMDVTLSTDGVREVGQFSNTFVKWEAVEKVITTAWAIYIYVSSASAVIVPRRHFESDEAFQRFAGLATRERSTSATSETTIASSR